MKPEKLNKFISQMKIELAEAESKHPQFADGLSERYAGNVKSMEMLENEIENAEGAK